VQGRLAVFCRLLVVAAMLPCASFAATAPLPLNWWSRGAGGGGAFFSPSLSPLDPGTLYISTDMGTVFHSVNGGAVWDSYAFGNLQGGRLARMQFTSDPAVLYVLDGRVDYVQYLGGAIFKTVDGGSSWLRLTSDPCLTNDATRKKLRADPARTDHLVLGHDRGLWFSGDGGTTWTAFYSPGSGCYLADTFFAGSNVFAAGNFGVYVSTNNGSSFAASPLTGIGAGEEIVAFTGAARSGQIRLYCITTDAATADAADDGYPSPAEMIYGSSSIYKGLYACDWGAGGWSKCTNGIRSLDVLAFVGAATNRPDIAYAAGESLDTGWPAIYQSTNAGTNWTRVFNGTQNGNVQTGWEGDQGDLDWSWGGGPLGFAVSPADPNQVVFCDWGFVHASTNGGAMWQALYVPPQDRNAANSYTPKRRAYHGIGLENTACWWLAWLDTNTLFASFSDFGALRSTNGGAAWIPAIADVNINTVYCCVTGAVNRAYIATSSIHCLYESTTLEDNPINGGTGAILFSTNRAASWAMLHDFAHPVIWLEPHPTNANIMYASVVHTNAGGIYVTSNLLSGAASTWTRLAVPPRTEGHPLSIHVLRDNTLACSYSGRLNPAGTFTHSSGVFVSMDGGASWADRSIANMQCWTRDLVIYPFDASQNTWFAGVFEAWGPGRPYNAGGLYRTTDRGQTWSAFKCDSYPSLYRVASIAFHPSNTNFAFITTENNGLLYSTNILAAAPAFLLAANYPFFGPRRVFTNPYDATEIWATSFGNGLRVGWLTEPRPVFDRLTADAGNVGYGGWGCDSQHLRIQASSNLAAWSDFATSLITGGRFAGVDATAGGVGRRFYRAIVASPITGSGP
jgi:photosystem II stability/assembly factor-like uncharacterized protein